jgi:crotonobetainyl-CoA:carnitine CoA-transferase CaiB-like acyl-CoA transferase
MGALSHIRVLDLSRVLAGPWASQILADLGADVIKVENPDGGDDTRHWGPPFMPDENGEPTEESAYYLSANRGKRSVCIDMRSPEGQARVRELAKNADVVLENFKVGGLAKYGLDYANLSAINPGLVYCSITGFGQSGPYRERPGYDFLIQAMGGIMSITGSPETGPQRVGVAVSDIMAGLYATIGILAALQEREQSGLGQHVDLALLDTTAAILANQASNYLVGGVLPGLIGNTHPNVVPYQVFATRDGHCIVAVGNDRQFRNCMTELGLPELGQDERYATNRARIQNRDRLVAIMEEKLRERDRDEWLARFAAAGVPCGPINTMEDVYQDPQILHREMVVTLDHPENKALKVTGNPIKLSRTPVEYHRPPPRLGEHSDEILEGHHWET